MPRPTIRRVAAVVLLAGIAGALVLTTYRPEGPLNDPEYPFARDSFSLPTELGGTHSFGWTSLRNSSSEPAILDRVSLHEAEGLELLGAYTTPDSEIPFGIESDHTFPPKGWERVPLTPAEGSVLPPYQRTRETDIALLLKLKIPDTKGAYSFMGITLEYHVWDVVVPADGALLAQAVHPA